MAAYAPAHTNLPPSGGEIASSLFAKYALDKLNAPIGVAEYQLQHQELPPELQSKLPTEEEIEKALGQSE